MSQTVTADPKLHGFGRYESARANWDFRMFFFFRRNQSNCLVLASRSLLRLGRTATDESHTQGCSPAPQTLYRILKRHFQTGHFHACSRRRQQRLIHSRIDRACAGGIQGVFRHFANDLDRTHAIAAGARLFYDQGQKVLVLTERTVHPDAIHAALAGKVSQTFALHGRMPKKQRAALATEFDLTFMKSTLHPAS